MKSSFDADSAEKTRDNLGSENKFQRRGSERSREADIERKQKESIASGIRSQRLEMRQGL
jgi:hypothetical protein